MSARPPSPSWGHHFASDFTRAFGEDAVLQPLVEEEDFGADARLGGEFRENFFLYVLLLQGIVEHLGHYLDFLPLLGCLGHHAQRLG